MIDREKVIDELKEGIDFAYHRCHCGLAVTMEMALALLNGREETTLEKDGHHIRCLKCGEYWCDNDREGSLFPMNFCPNCGRKVKWDD